jgi:hypothetical protein
MAEAYELHLAEHRLSLIPDGVKLSGNETGVCRNSVSVTQFVQSRVGAAQCNAK